MTRRFSLVISWSCAAVILAVPVVALYFLLQINAFAEFIRATFGLPVQWASVAAWQWYLLWVLTAGYLALGLAGLFWLRKAFSNFADGELFNLANSLHLRRFSVLLLAQSVAKPVHYALASLVLSANHPAGQKMLSLSFGSGELKSIGLAMAFWVISNLLIEGCRLQTENRQFI